MILSTCSSPRVMGRPWYQKLESLNLGFSALVVPRNKTVVWVAKAPSWFLRHLNTQQHRQSCPNNSHKQAQNPVVVLLDSGNLVIKIKGEADPEAYLWQSFDNSSDTLLPGMKLGSNLRTGLNRRYTSWKSPDDPSPGDVYRVLVLNYPEVYMVKGTQKLLRYGPWNGLYFSGMPDQRKNPFFYLIFVKK